MSVQLGQIRTAICPVTLSGADYRRAHDSCYLAAKLWNQAVDWVHAEWHSGRSPGKYDIRAFLTSLPRGDRPLHAHTTEAIGYDLYEAIKTSRTNRKNGMKLRAPWRKKNYRPLSFSKGYGWRIINDRLHLSLGRRRPGILLPVPVVIDSTTGKQVTAKMWGEIKCGSKRQRRLTIAKKKANADAKAQLRDFDHQVASKAASHVISHDSGRLVYGDVRGIEQKTKKCHTSGRHQRQSLSQWSRGQQERYLNEKTGLKGEHLDESGSTKTCPVCGARNRPSGRDYRCKNPDCGFRCHRDAVGAINILQMAVYGTYVPIGPDVTIRVTYLRAVERWSDDQRKAHRKVQSRKARALSSAQNRALVVETQPSKPTLANPSTSSKEPDPLVVVA